MEKPFHLQELEARVRSLTRRKFVQKNICLECGKLRFDTRERVAYAENNPVVLTRKENGILEYLLLNQPIFGISTPLASFTYSTVFPSINSSVFSAGMYAVLTPKIKSGSCYRSNYGTPVLSTGINNRKCDMIGTNKKEQCASSPTPSGGTRRTSCRAASERSHV